MNKRVECAGSGDEVQFLDRLHPAVKMRAVPNDRQVPPLSGVPMKPRFRKRLTIKNNTLRKLFSQLGSCCETVCFIMRGVNTDR